MGGQWRRLIRIQGGLWSPRRPTSCRQTRGLHDIAFHYFITWKVEGKQERLGSPFVKSPHSNKVKGRQAVEVVLCRSIQMASWRSASDPFLTPNPSPNIALKQSPSSHKQPQNTDDSKRRRSKTPHHFPSPQFVTFSYAICTFVVVVGKFPAVISIPTV